MLPELYPEEGSQFSNWRQPKNLLTDLRLTVSHLRLFRIDDDFFKKCV
jgi:hypothetical protein